MNMLKPAPLPVPEPLVLDSGLATVPESCSRPEVSVATSPASETAGSVASCSRSRSRCTSSRKRQRPSWQMRPERHSWSVMHGPVCTGALGQAARWLAKTTNSSENDRRLNTRASLAADVGKLAIRSASGGGAGCELPCGWGSQPALVRVQGGRDIAVALGAGGTLKCWFGVVRPLRFGVVAAELAVASGIAGSLARPQRAWLGLAFGLHLAMK